MKPLLSDSEANRIVSPPVETAGEQLKPERDNKRLLGFALFALALSLAFGGPLLGLVRYALQTDLHSHAILIPFISGYLIWLMRKEPWPAFSTSPAVAVIPLAIALVVLKRWLLPSATSSPLLPNDYFALTTFCYLGLLWTGALLFLGGRFLYHFLFPSVFLIFIVPMPSAMENLLEVFFQHTSADAAALLFNVSGTTVFRDKLIFRLPGIVIQVAQECSGIRSSYVLFITSLMAGHIFLKSPWLRAGLTFFVIPLAILRNGFRIFTIAMLCVHVSPAMIDSPIHHQGGPLFFALSLIPFFLCLLWLWRIDRRRAAIKQGSRS